MINIYGPDIGEWIKGQAQAAEYGKRRDMNTTDNDLVWRPVTHITSMYLLYPMIWFWNFWCTDFDPDLLKSHL